MKEWKPAVTHEELFRTAKYMTVSQIEEAISIAKAYMQTEEAKHILKRWGSPTLMIYTVANVYHAGRMQGKREERNRKAGH